MLTASCFRSGKQRSEARFVLKLSQLCRCQYGRQNGCKRRRVDEVVGAGAYSVSRDHAAEADEARYVLLGLEVCNAVSDEGHRLVARGRALDNRDLAAVPPER